MKSLTVAIPLVLLLAAGTLRAQDAQLTGDIERMIRDGLAEPLEARLRGGRTPEEKHQLAQAYANKARRTRQPAERVAAYTAADQKYRAWVDALAELPLSGDLAGTVRLAAARAEYGGLLLSGPVALGVDDHEISGGRWGDTAALQGWLSTARQQYEAAAQALAPLVDEVSSREEDLLAAGVFDALLQTDLDVSLNLGWTNYYLAVLAKGEDGQRFERLAAAQKLFQKLLDSGQLGGMAAHCRMALGMTQREQGRLPEAEKTLAAALDADPSPAVAAQVRYELARTQLKGRKFDEARTTLRPLVEQDPDRLAPEQNAGRFYFNLAHLWDANSYLLEAESVRGEARDGVARTALLQKARRLRESGLAKLKRLAQRGDPWPTLVQLYVAASVDTQTPLRELSVVELLYTAGALLEAHKYDAALERLREAAGRTDTEKDLAGDVLFELGRCRHLLNDTRGAATAFAQLAADHRQHARAAQAATFAYQLWGQLAEQSHAAGDYSRLADTLRNLLASFADHPQRAEAVWLLPCALQLAGRFDEAADEFAKLPADSPHAEEAQFRRVLCRRKAVEATRATLSADEYRARATQAATGLLRYADEAAARAGDEPLRWSAEARLAAAELLLSTGVDDARGALTALEKFDDRGPAHALLGRVLAVRIRAYRGLRDYGAASRMLSQFLQTAAPEEIGATLAGLALGMQSEVERLLAEGADGPARELAQDAIATFDELAKWVHADASRSASEEPVLAGRARMLYLAGQFEPAEAAVRDLLKRAPRNGNYQYLQAQVLTARLAADAPPDALTAAQEAWAALLSDPAIRRRAPERYWEARYNWLALALRLGRATEVDSAITQERIWRPELGGTPWREKLEALLRAARTAQGLPPDSQPATQSQTATNGG